MTTHRIQYVLEYVVSDVHARVSVNDVPVFLHHSGKSIGASEQVNPWLVDEPTEIRMEAAGVLVDGAPAGELAMVLVARIEGDRERELLEVRLPRDASDIVTEGTSWRAQHIVRVADLARPPSDFWPHARPLTLSDDDRATIHELVLRCQRALDGMNVEVLDEAFGFQLADTARAYHVSKDDMLTTLVFALESAVGDGEIDPHSEEGLAALEASMQLHLVGRDRLVWVTREGYANALQVPAVDPKVSMKIYLARRNERWTIVR